MLILLYAFTDMDMELAAVVTAVSKNKSLKHLHMGRNMANIKAKHIASIMDALVQMLQVMYLHRFFYHI